MTDKLIVEDMWQEVDFTQRFMQNFVTGSFDQEPEWSFGHLRYVNLVMEKQKMVMNIIF